MKRMGIYAILMISTFVIGSCARNVDRIRVISVSTRQDVFLELKEKPSIPQGYADLKIFASFKTHKPGAYGLERGKTHGTPEYRLLINIDGQALFLKGETIEEDSHPRFMRDPEAGSGMRYIFEKEIRLKAGKHTIYFSLPEDNVVVEKEIFLGNKSFNVLLLEPVYGGTRGGIQKPTYYGMTSFYQGITGFRLILNGEPQ